MSTKKTKTVKEEVITESNDFDVNALSSIYYYRGERENVKNEVKTYELYLSYPEFKNKLDKYDVIDGKIRCGIYSNKSLAEKEKNKLLDKNILVRIEEK